MVNLEIENLLQQVLIKLEQIIKLMPKDGEQYDKNFQYIDNSDLLKLLKISARTAQDYRDRGILPHSKIQSKLFYKLSDIEQMMMKHFNKKVNQ